MPEHISDLQITLWLLHEELTYPDHLTSIIQNTGYDQNSWHPFSRPPRIHQPDYNHLTDNHPGPILGLSVQDWSTFYFTIRTLNFSFFLATLLEFCSFLFSCVSGLQTLRLLNKSLSLLSRKASRIFLSLFDSPENSSDLGDICRRWRFLVEKAIGRFIQQRQIEPAKHSLLSLSVYLLPFSRRIKSVYLLKPLDSILGSPLLPFSPPFLPWAIPLAYISHLPAFFLFDANEAGEDMELMKGDPDSSGSAEGMEAEIIREKRMIKEEETRS